VEAELVLEGQLGELQLQQQQQEQVLPEQMVEGQGLLQLAVEVEVLLAQQVQVQVLVQVHFPPLEGVEEVQGLQVLVVLQQLGEVLELRQGVLLLRSLPSDVGRLRQRS